MSSSDIEQLAERRRGSGVSTVYEKLRNEIIDLTLAPGTPLEEKQLSERFQMSRTPIREALLKLAADGLVVTLTNRSTVVSHIDLLSLSAYFDALTLMYRVNTRLAAENATAEDLEIMEALQAEYAAAVESGDALKMITVNRDFHVAMAEAGRNKYYRDLFVRLLDEGRRLLRLYYTSFNDQLPREYSDQHEDQIQAIRNRDVELADKLAKAHADQIVIQIQRYISEDKRQDITL
ncbi:Transcriptional regulator, GntR family [Nitrincola lacisaponensis]|uniref:Transcriptional regulator, GntR family n=1 Tax=Nitrincola lacisaponensis TaxID=267850 RepID=A0A063XY25_9GAMM|nr:GntR family transcriptional regulator [Nitrincola lacisaponensis]KDE39038.1 Transcriptional regulator, GntR family [Nitrincola lacisaponensis]